MLKRTLNCQVRSPSRNQPEPQYYYFFRVCHQYISSHAKFSDDKGNKPLDSWLISVTMMGREWSGS
jgi:hypothetical protein